MPDDPRVLPRLTRRAQKVMDELVVQRGLSYADAIAQARAMAYEASRPYLQVAAYLEHQLAEMERAGV